MEQLGVNLCSPKCSSPLKQMISSFFERDDVTRVCPDRQKVATDPSDPERKVPLRYRMAYLKTLHLKFVAECELSCSYETFTRNVPFNVRKPSASDWGTCLCATCLNPELKLEKLPKLKKIEEGLQENMDDEKFAKLIQNIESLQEIEKAVDTDVEEEITFPEWQKVENPKSKKKGSKISRKVQSTLKMSRFIKLLVNELTTLKDHLHRVHMQFKAFKDAREQATRDVTIATIQVDWSENTALRQAKEEKSAYYGEDQISLHTMHIWTTEGNKSIVAASDCTDHSAPAVFASIESVMQDLVANGKNTINVESDSPLSQYRNKNVFWMIEQFSKNNQTVLKWIYLETGHGKGIPDGIGAVVKRAISDIIAMNPDKSIYSVNDLLILGLAERVPSIIVIQYREEEVQAINKQLPELVGVKGTLKIREVSAEIENGSVRLYGEELSNQKPFPIFMETRKISTKLKEENSPRKQKTVSFLTKNWGGGALSF